MIPLRSIAAPRNVRAVLTSRHAGTIRNPVMRSFYQARQFSNSGDDRDKENDGDEDGSVEDEKGETSDADGSALFSELLGFQQKSYYTDTRYDPLDAFAKQDGASSSSSTGWQQSSFSRNSGFPYNSAQTEQPTPAERCNIQCENGSDFHPVNVELLSQFVSSFGKILPRRKSGLTEIQQRRMAKAVKQARHLGLMPFVGKPATAEDNPDECVTVRTLRNYERVIEKRVVGLPKHTRVPVD